MENVFCYSFNRLLSNPLATSRDLFLLCLSANIINLCVDQFPPYSVALYAASLVILFLVRWASYLITMTVLLTTPSSVLLGLQCSATHKFLQVSFVSSPSLLTLQLQRGGSSYNQERKICEHAQHEQSTQRQRLFLIQPPASNLNQSVEEA